MNIKQEVFSKITELSKQREYKVDLALVDDIQKSIDATKKVFDEVAAANKAMDESAAFSNKILKDAIEADKAYDKAAALNEKAVKNGNAQVDKAIAMLNKVKSAADALGLDGTSVKGFTELEKMSITLEDEVSYADNDAFKAHPGWISKK